LISNENPIDAEPLLGNKPINKTCKNQSSPDNKKNEKTNDIGSIFGVFLGRFGGYLGVFGGGFWREFGGVFRKFLGVI